MMLRLCTSLMVEDYHPSHPMELPCAGDYETGDTLYSGSRQVATFDSLKSSLELVSMAAAFP